MTREEVLTLLPEIKLIHSTDLQEKSITCWQQVLELGGWDKKGVDTYRPTSPSTQWI